MSSMPEGDSVSIMAVVETMDLKVVFTGWCLSLLPSQSPARAGSFLKAAVEYVAASTLVAAATAKSAKINTRFLMGTSRASAWNPPHLCVWTGGSREGKQARYRILVAEATSMMGFGIDFIVRTKAATTFASNCPLAQRSSSASASAAARAFLYVRSLVMVS